MSDTMTILIHGTFSQFNIWFRPMSSFHRMMRSIFPNDYFEMDNRKIFTWNAGEKDRDRRKAAKRLVRYCERSGYKKFRFVGHSHGGTVANLATQQGIQLSSLILLATPVRFATSYPPVAEPYYPDDYLPNLENVESGRFFHFYSDGDFIVRAAGGNQNYAGTAVQDAEDDYMSDLLYPWNHWEPTRSQTWRKMGWDHLVRASL